MLRLVHCEHPSPNATWRIEVPTPGVVLIDIDVTRQPLQVPLHWRAGTFKKPPLDIMFDIEGRLLGFQFVVQDEKVMLGEATPLAGRVKGLPVFDVTGWPEDRYLDEEMGVRAARLPSGELSIQPGETRETTTTCAVGERLLFAFAADASLAEIRVGPLSADDWDSIDIFSTTLA